MQSSSSGATSFLNYLPLVVTGLVVGGLLTAYATVPEFREFLREAVEVLSSDDKQRVTRWVAQFGWRGPLLLIIAMIAQLFLIVVPSWLLMVVAVLAYGPVWGTAITMVGVTAAATVGYLVGSWVGAVAVRRLVGDKTEQKVENWVNEYGFWAVALARISPFVSGDAISLVSGLTGMRFRRFISGTILGALPLAAAIGYFGENFSQLKQGFLWISITSLLIFAGYLLYDRRRKSS